jgi:predicted DNA-binding transcriptional regulator YafY
MPARVLEKTPRRSKGKALPRDLVLLQCALILLRGGVLTYERMQDEFRLERRTAERYVRALREVGLPIVSQRRHRELHISLDKLRAKLDIDGVDVAPESARSLSLLLVAGQLLPAHLGVREAVDRTVRAALRLRNMKAAGELRRIEDTVLVLENDAKDYKGKANVFGALVEAVLDGSRVRIAYRSPKKRESTTEEGHCASIGLYKGGLYVLVVPQGEWKALERIESLVPVDGAPLSLEVRLKAIEQARARWGPARPSSGEQVITLHFSEAAAPYVLARPWHARASSTPWPASDGGGLRMSLRLSGQTDMFESWVKSWGREVQVLRPRAMAERIAHDLDAAARAHREAATKFARDVDDA